MQKHWLTLGQLGDLVSLHKFLVSSEFFSKLTHFIMYVSLFPEGSCELHIEKVSSYPDKVWDMSMFLLLLTVVLETVEAEHMCRTVAWPWPD